LGHYLPQPVGVPIVEMRYSLMNVKTAALATRRIAAAGGRYFRPGASGRARPSNPRQLDALRHATDILE